MIEIKLYEPLDVCHRTSGLPIAIPVGGYTSWNVPVGGRVTVMGLSFTITKLFPTVSRDVFGAHLYALAEYSGGVGALAGWLGCTKQLPGGRWAGYLTRVLDEVEHHVATAGTAWEATRDIGIVSKALDLNPDPNVRI